MARARTIIYARVSTREQGESGAGLSAQITSCVGYATQQGWSVAGVYQDVASGDVMPNERSGLRDAINELRRDSVLLVAKRDRLGRGQLVIATIDAMIAGKRSRCVSAAGEGTDQQGSAGVLTRGIFDTFAAFERERGRERTREAMQALRRAGRRVGDIPIGKRLADDGRTLIDDEAEQAALAVIRELRGTGLSYRAIADALAAQGHEPRGRQWHAMTIKRALTG